MKDAAMTTYRRKPSVLHAVQWTGDPEPLWDFGLNTFAKVAGSDHIEIATQSCAAPVPVGIGDWIVRDVTGDLLVVTGDVFDAQYEYAGPPPSPPTLAVAELEFAEPMEPAPLGCDGDMHVFPTSHDGAGCICGRAHMVILVNGEGGA